MDILDIMIGPQFITIYQLFGKSCLLALNGGSTWRKHQKKASRDYFSAILGSGGCWDDFRMVIPSTGECQKLRTSSIPWWLNKIAHEMSWKKTYESCTKKVFNYGDKHDLPGDYLGHVVLSLPGPCWIKSSWVLPIATVFYNPTRVSTTDFENDSMIIQCCQTWFLIMKWWEVATL